MGSFRPVSGNPHLHGYYISPSLSLRQCPNHYTFRAGRNLPDKEFRYLRTVIVTAAVYRGFAVKLAYAITLYDRLPIGLRVPLEASVTLLEATTPVKLPTNQCPHIHGLESKQMKGRISTAAPQTLACLIHSLRPILHIDCPNSM